MIWLMAAGLGLTLHPALGDGGMRGVSRPAYAAAAPAMVDDGEAGVSDPSGSEAASPGASADGAAADGAGAAAPVSASGDGADFGQIFRRIAASLSAAPTGKWDYAQYQNGATIEPGIYDAGGFTQTGGAVRLVARIPGTVIIRIPAGQYFLTISGNVNEITVDGLSFVGGKGAFLLTNPQYNVSLAQSFTRNLFFNYTEAAIANAAIDHPYLVARDNVFMGAPGSPTIGIAWGGYGPYLIEHNHFLRNAYHLAIGPRLGGDIKVIYNDFISFGGTATKADIWIKPNNTDAYGVNSGAGSLIAHNKFGNENQNPAAPRILIADEDPASGSNRATRQPSDADKATSFVSGFEISGNLIASNYGVSAPFLLSNISELRQLIWRDNRFVGSGHSYLVYFANPRGGAGFADTNSDFQLTNADVTAGSIVAQHFSNAGFAALRDYAGFFPGDVNAVEVWPVSDDPGLALLGTDLAAGAREVFGSARMVAAAGPRGAGDYALVTLADLHAGVAMPLSGAPAAGGPVFVELALKAAGAHGLAWVRIELGNAATGQTALVRRVPVPSTIGRFLSPAYLPPSTRPDAWQLRVFAENPQPGVADAFVTGGWVVNLGAGRMGLGAARALCCGGGAK